MIILGNLKLGDDKFHFHDNCKKKKKNLLGFLLFEPLLIRDGYYTKSFHLIATNTSAHAVMRGVVRILKNIKR